MKVDLCVFLAGNKLEEYTPLFIETLFMNCDTSNLHIHVVEKGTFPGYTDTNTYPDVSTYKPVGKHIHEYLLRKKEEVSIPFTIYEMHDPSVFFRNSQPSPPGYDQVSDHGNTMNWSMDNCGTNKWVIICHSDMVFVGDIITEFMKEMNDWTGLYGIFSHIFAVNREAFKKVGVKFNSVSNFRAVPVNHNGFDYVVRSGGDPRCGNDFKILYGWDVIELLELMMIANGWRCYMSQFEATEMCALVDHMCSGHEYSSDAELLRNHASKRQNWMDLYKINRIEGDS